MTKSWDSSTESSALDCGRHVFVQSLCKTMFSTTYEGNLADLTNGSIPCVSVDVTAREAKLQKPNTGSQVIGFNCWGASDHSYLEVMWKNLRLKHILLSRCQSEQPEGPSGTSKKLEKPLTADNHGNGWSGLAEFQPSWKTNTLSGSCFHFETCFDSLLLLACQVHAKYLRWHLLVRPFWRWNTSAEKVTSGVF